MLADEYGTASNIKSRVNRLSVLGAITSVQHRLKLYTKVPPMGLVIYCGTIVTEEGMEFKGKKAKTVGGLTKDTLIKSKSGKIVSKAASARGKKRYAGSALKKWGDAVKAARKQLGISGFCAVGGKTAQGKALYAKAKSIVGK